MVVVAADTAVVDTAVAVAVDIVAAAAAAADGTARAGLAAVAGHVAAAAGNYNFGVVHRIATGIADGGMSSGLSLYRLVFRNGRYQSYKRLDEKLR